MFLSINLFLGSMDCHELLAYMVETVDYAFALRRSWGPKSGCIMPKKFLIDTGDAAYRGHCGKLLCLTKQRCHG